MKRGARWMTVVAVGICSFALLARDGELRARCGGVGVGRRRRGRASRWELAARSKRLGLDQAVAADGGGTRNAGGPRSGAAFNAAAGVSAGVGVGSGFTIKDEAMQDALVAQERAGLEALKAGDVAGFAAMLGEEAVFVDDHGPATKAEVVKNVGGFRIIDYSMEDVRLVRVSDAAGVIVYRLTEHGASHGKEFNAVVYVSTLYALRGGKWVSLFSQETGRGRCRDGEWRGGNAKIREWSFGLSENCG